MVLGFHSRPSHVAQNIIVGLDFDGTISYSFHLRVAYAKKNYGVDLPRVAAFWKRNPELCNSYLERYKKEAARAKVRV